MSLNPPSINFGSVAVGSTVSDAVMITNTGTATLNVSQVTLSGQQFSLSPISLPVSIAVGQKVTATIGFSPTSGGSASGSISITSDASGTPVTVALLGTGAAATHLLGANPTTLTFGNVNDGGGKNLGVSLTNNGNSDITISSVGVAGAGFGTSGVGAGTTLTPNQSIQLTVSFDPASPGGVNGTVTVASNATNGPTTISVSGTGVQSTSHSVDLSWTASPSSGVVGYNVYRGSALGSYSRISSSPDPGITYTDSSVQSGQNLQYFYVVTAVDSTGVESTDSNPASVTVP